MINAITDGVVISVECSYKKEYSNPALTEFLFAYRITIENKNAFPIKLWSRYWHIFDSNNSIKEVEGDGVVGVQPIIQPNEQYNYISACSLQTEIGKMQGTYTMQNLYTLKKFKVRIPVFNLIYPGKLN